jgi:hypothetical protein
MTNTRTLIAATLQKHEPEIVDNITKDFILFKLFGDKDLAPKLFNMRKPPEGAMYAEGIKLTDDPGRTIVEKIRKGRNSTNGAYERFDIIDTTPQDNHDEVEMQWKSMAGSVHLANEDLDKNAGSKTKIFDLLSASEDDLVLSQQEKLNDFLLGSVPNDAAGRKRPTGLLDWVQDDPTSLPAAGSSVIGGIDASLSANSYWRNQVKNHAAASFGTDQTGTGHANLRQLVRDCTFGMRKGSTVLLAGEDAFEALEKSLVSQVRYNDPRINALVNAGFEAIMFKNIPVVMEKQIDVQREANSLSGSAFYLLNSHVLRVWGMKNKWFKLGQYREPTNQDSQVALCITRLQMTCRGRRQLGVMFNVT